MRERTLQATVLFGIALTLGTAPTAAGQCQVAKVAPNDGERDDRFGNAAAVSSDTLAIGTLWDDDAGYNAGAVYVAQRIGAAWLFVAKLTPDAGGGFGGAVAMDGSLLIVAGVGNARKSVYERIDGTWTKMGELIRDDYEPGQRIEFGFSVGLSGDITALGAPGDDELGPESGSVYLFERAQDGTWPQVAKLFAEDAEYGNQFGYAVGIHGDVIVVGAPLDYDWESGAAYVFEREGGGGWSQVAKLIPDDGHWTHGFGYAVAVSGYTVVVGASDAEGQEPYAGAVYVFERDEDGVWTQTAKLMADDGDVSDAFGAAVASDQNVVLVGNRGDDDLGDGSGSAYVFVRNVDGTWTQTAKLLAADGARGDWFGTSVDVDGHLTVIGASLDNDHGADSGSAYVFAVGPDDDGDGVMDACECPGDLNEDWSVDQRDLTILLYSWGFNDAGDCDGDGDTDHADLGILLANWGEVCP